MQKGNDLQLTMLGVGSSAGTPAIACQCQTCLSSNPRNKRTRCSSLITLPTGENILIDTGPDLRLQALREGIKRVDAVLYTHAHADHLHGIDDLRAFCQVQRKQIPLYGNIDTISHIQEKFGYTLREPSNFWDLPVLSAHVVSQPFSLFGVEITPITILHGRITIYGYRIGNLAYLTDVSAIPDISMPLLQDLDVLMIDCLREEPHSTHINVEQSLNLINQINAKQSYLIHMTHELEYEALSKRLSEKISVGYDGLKINFNHSCKSD